jgi:hypothetical protein
VIIAVSIRPNGALPPAGVVVAVMHRTLPGAAVAGYCRHAARVPPPGRRPGRFRTGGPGEDAAT